MLKDGRRTADDRSPGARSCGSCTACCDGWLRIVIDGHEVEPGRPCPYSTGRSCSIYADRPVDPCRRFTCGWLAAGSPLPDWMRPDRSNFILLPAELRWRGAPIDLLVPCGGEPKKKGLDWVMSFATASRRLLLYRLGDEWYALGPPLFQREMSERLQRGESIWTALPDLAP